MPRRANCFHAILRRIDVAARVFGRGFTTCGLVNVAGLTINKRNNVARPFAVVIADFNAPNLCVLGSGGDIDLELAEIGQTH